MKYEIIDHRAEEKQQAERFAKELEKLKRHVQELGGFHQIN